MVVIQRPHVQWMQPRPVAGRPRRASEAWLDVETARLFLRAQQSWLRRGLDRAHDPVALGIVLGTHDVCHESWLSLIAAVGRFDDTAVEALSSLYAFHGRVVGSLEGGATAQLDAAVGAEVRSMLQRRLGELTDAAVDAVERLRRPQPGDERTLGVISG